MKGTNIELPLPELHRERVLRKEASPEPQPAQPSRVQIALPVRDAPFVELLEAPPGPQPRQPKRPPQQTPLQAPPVPQLAHPSRDPQQPQLQARPDPPPTQPIHQQTPLQAAILEQKLDGLLSGASDMTELRVLQRLCAAEDQVGIGPHHPTVVRVEENGRPLGLNLDPIVVGMPAQAFKLMSESQVEQVRKKFPEIAARYSLCLEACLRATPTFEEDRLAVLMDFQDECMRKVLQRPRFLDEGFMQHWTKALDIIDGYHPAEELSTFRKCLAAMMCLVERFEN